jgi:putative ABC transport system ATP-binding protein
MTDDAHRAEGNDVVLRAERVSKSYPDGDVHALIDVSVSIHRGDYVAIMGPSGSGKSTLLNMLGALDLPTTGEVYIDGQAVSRMSCPERLRTEMIGFVFQSFYLLPTLTARENVQIPMFELSLTARARARKADALLDAVGMNHRAGHFPSQLSVGERQRVTIARALANDPLILLADEPTGNLDTSTGEEILALFSRLHRERNMTLVVITHDEEVATRAERVVRVRDGKIESDEPSHAIGKAG